MTELDEDELCWTTELDEDEPEEVEEVTAAQKRVRPAEAHVPPVAVYPDDGWTAHLPAGGVGVAVRGEDARPVRVEEFAIESLLHMAHMQ